MLNKRNSLLVQTIFTKFINKKNKDMLFYHYLKDKLPHIMALCCAFVLISCGSYQYVGYSSDGIYDDAQSEVVYEEEPTSTETDVNSTSNSYYKHYFTEKANQYSDLPQDENVIFTDIDSYESDYADENQEEERQSGYAGWGQANENITINYIDYGWNYSNPWLWNGAWGWRYGWNRPWGWNAGLGWGWNTWGWNNYWSWNNYYWGWNYGTWCPPGYNGYYYNNRGVAYNYGRRGSSVLNRNSTVSRRNTSSISPRRSSSTIRRSSNIRRNTNSTIRNSTRTRSNTSVRSRANTRSTIRRGNTISRPRSSTRSNISTPRTRSSSSVRSSSPSRSSGASRSSGRSGSGRRR